MEKRLSDALFLAIRNFANSQSPSMNKATIDAYQGVYIPPMLDTKGFGCVYISFGVGFCVARFTVMGNAKASNSGTSNRYSCPAFFIYAKTAQRIYPVGEA